MTTVRRDRVGAEYVWVPPRDGREWVPTDWTPLQQRGGGGTAAGHTGSLAATAALTRGYTPALAGFCMMRTPVTNAMWRLAVQDGAVPEPLHNAAFNDAVKAQHPVVHVTREQARAYAAWVGGRLPHDAEWTRAAQGDDGRTYPWGEAEPDATRANYTMNVGNTTPVGRYPAWAARTGCSTWRATCGSG